MKSNRRFLDLSGSIYGELEVLNPIPDERSERGCRLYLCRCSCGKLVKKGTDELRHRSSNNHCGDIRHQKTPKQRCWTCANAYGGCEWSEFKNPQPVPGWDAKPTKIRISEGLFDDSYAIRDCPKYIPDKRSKP